jgi:glycosyltransferase involved in cell wall biosynthesis
VRAAWLSPTAGNSGIVEYSRQVVPALASHLEIDVWTHGAPDLPPEGVTVVDYQRSPQRLNELQSYDVVIFNIGNHLGFHRRELELSRQFPGVVILHDRTLHHLWAGFYITHCGRPDLYAERMTALYGARGSEVAAAVIAQLGAAAWSDPEEVLQHNFIPDTLAGALGAVVHSHGHAADVRRIWTGPVCDLAFPAYASQLRRASAVPPDRRQERLRLVSIGHVDGHKQIHELINVLRADRALADRVTYTVLGDYDPRGAYVRDLNRLIADGGLARTVTLLGHQPAGVLQRHLDGADVFVNLRLPNLESGSASLMEQLARGRPVLVHPTGSFGELPSEVVVKVPSGDPAAVSKALCRLLDSPQLRRRVGAAARAHAESVSTTLYGEVLARFIVGATLWPARRSLAARAGRALSELGLNDPAQAQTTAAGIDRLLAPARQALSRPAR